MKNVGRDRKSYEVIKDVIMFHHKNVENAKGNVIKTEDLLRGPVDQEFVYDVVCSRKVKPFQI